MFLRERLKALRDGWEELGQMWDNRQTLLTQSLNYQMFTSNAKQAEVLLSQQEHVLSKEEVPVSVNSLSFFLLQAVRDRAENTESSSCLSSFLFVCL
jgi:hypothetical protein